MRIDKNKNSSINVVLAVQQQRTSTDGRAKALGIWFFGCGYRSCRMAAGKEIQQCPLIGAIEVTMRLSKEELKIIANKWNYRPDTNIDKPPMPRKAAARRMREMRLKLERLQEEIRLKREFEL